MSTPRAELQEGATGFRLRLLIAMMLVVIPITGAALYLVQRDASERLQDQLEQDFQSELRFLQGAQSARLAAITERCRTLARSVRLRAALEEDDVADLYLNAEVELRDVLAGPEDGESDTDSHTLRAQFFRFLNAKGAVLSPVSEGAESRTTPVAWETELAKAGGSDQQQIGYVLIPGESGRSTFQQVIATPIVATDTRENVGAIVLGFKPDAIHVGKAGSEVKAGLWLNGELHMESQDSALPAALTNEVTHAIAARGNAGSSFPVNVNGARYLLFYRELNPGSSFSPAYQVCLFPLADALARQQWLRWKIIGAGVLVLLGGFALSDLLAGHIARPVQQLAEVSANNRAGRVRAEAALEITEQKYRSIFENAVEGIFLSTLDGRYLSANPALARIYGYESPEQLLAKLTDIDHQLYVEPGRRAEFMRLIHEHGSVQAFESQVYRQDGSIVWISENARLARDDSGSGLTYYEGLVQDVTERRQAADELLTLNAELQAALQNLQATQQQVIQQERLRALGQMASGIAHDFNNALVPILGFCELLLLSPAILDDKQKAARYLETIQTAAKDASSVVGRLREFYRADKGEKRFEPVNLKRLAEQAITLTRPKWKDQAQASGATISVALELETVPPIAGDESALREVLTNLIFNAVDAMPGGGTLTLRTKNDGNTASIEVADTGMGMTEEVRKRCLEPFFSTKGDRGTGLGLSMVFGIVKRHSGLLDLQSIVGKGTCFRITLPLAEVTSATPAALLTAKPQRSIRVLVVDDEAPVRDTLAAILSADGHEVEVAHDGADGLKRFMAGRFDLVVTDKAMPAMSGDQMATAIKRVAPQMPIILLTGFGLFHGKSEFPDIDVLASKPIRIPALREAIATAMQPK